MTSPPSIERYEFRGLLGRGGFASVYRAYDRRLDREVALKLLHPHIVESPQAMHSFLEEARRLARLHHPNIVTVYDVGEADGIPYFTMEILDGQSFARLVSPGQALPTARVIELVRPLCSAVEYLHRRGIVHRDIKGANVQLTDEGLVVLMDFGIARVLEDTLATFTVHVSGTPEAISPEQIRSGEVGPAADIYALGILTYRLLVGRPPFVGTQEQLLFAHVNEDPLPLRSLVPSVPAHIARAVQDALAKSPSMRPQSAAAYLAALEEEPAVSGFETQPALPAASSMVQTDTLPATGDEPGFVALPSQTTERGATVRLARQDTTIATPPRTRPSGSGASRRLLAGTVTGLALAAAAVAVIVLNGRGRHTPAAVANPVAGQAADQVATPAQQSTPPTTLSPTPASQATATVQPSPTPTPTPTLLSAADVPDRDILRAGASIVQRGVLPGSGADPGEIVLYSQATSAGGCAQPYIDLLRRDAAGRWASVWQATSSPAGAPLVAPAQRSQSGACSPVVKLFTVRPLEAGGEPRVLFSTAAADGSQHLAVLGWDGAAQQATVLAEVQTTPGAETNLGDEQPAAISLVESAYPPAASGLSPQYGAPTGRLSMLLTWQKGSLVASGGKFAPNCAQGSLTTTAGTADSGALQYACADGSAGAVAVSSSTSFGGGPGFQLLAAGDDVTVAFADGALQVADPLNALPTAASLSSSAAVARQQAATAPPPTRAAPAPATRAPQPAAQAQPSRQQPVTQPVTQPAPAAATVPPQPLRQATVPPQ